MLADLLLLAACGGLYSVPLYAIVQEQSEPSHRARMIAANNIVNAVIMVLGAGFVAGFAAAGVSAPRVLEIAAVANFVVARLDRPAAAADRVPRAVPVVFSAVPQGRASRGLENLPLAGERSIVVINHLSFLDGCLVAAFLPGDLVFAIDTDAGAAVLVPEIRDRHVSRRSGAIRWQSERW